jgi:minor histocompatibility antigen H13
VSKSWIYNNILAIVFCIHALQFIFLGNFKNGAILLTLLFFYDIFFVFGTDVMITVAKNIDAPIKLQFPRDMSVDPPQYSILGLGDIVIPGIFVSLCLRFDFLKNLRIETFSNLAEKERKGTGETNSFINYLIDTANNSGSSYFGSCIVGYLIAIITTVVIMILFDHGQPALLYLVPGCLLSVLFTSLVRGEFKLMWEFSEDKFLAPEGDEKKD